MTICAEPVTNVCQSNGTCSINTRTGWSGQVRIGVWQNGVCSLRLQRQLLQPRCFSALLGTVTSCGGVEGVVIAVVLGERERVRVDCVCRARRGDGRFGSPAALH